MLTKRIIPCLDVRNGQVVKGTQFKNHQVVGDIVSLAQKYCDQGADELVFYDIIASIDNVVADRFWIRQIASHINIPFCVAGGIRSIEDAANILNNGADKVSINSPALKNPALITALADTFGAQCVVVGIDSLQLGNEYRVCQFTGSSATSRRTSRLTLDWAQQVEQLGAGELVINCMNQDGMRNGYDIDHLAAIKMACSIPVIASGGAGKLEDFYQVFDTANVDGALAASVFHKKQILIPELKAYLQQNNIEVRP